MSEDYYIGLSRAQIQNLLKGHTQGKRPYTKPVKGKPRYLPVRIHIQMLTDAERNDEKDSAFNWGCYQKEKKSK